MSTVQEQVLEAANQIAGLRPDYTFSPKEIVQALAHLNENTVRTHVVSRCCINAPKNHPHKWPYFRRLGRSKYQVAPRFRQKPRGPAGTAGRFPASEQAGSTTGGSGPKAGARREVIHGVIQRDKEAYVVECLELAVVTQGRTLDEVVENFRQALALHVEGENMAELGLAEHPRVELIYDTALAS